MNNLQNKLISVLIEYVILLNFGTYQDQRERILVLLNEKCESTFHPTMAM
jgi:hypothetical protein